MIADKRTHTARQTNMLIIILCKNTADIHDDTLGLLKAASDYRSQVVIAITTYKSATSILHRGKIVEVLITQHELIN